MAECRLTASAKDLSMGFWAEGCPYPSRDSLYNGLMQKADYFASLPSCDIPQEPLPYPMPEKLGLVLSQPVSTDEYTLVDENITDVKSTTYPAFNGLNQVYVNPTELHGSCSGLSASFWWKADEYTGIIESTFFTRTYRKNCTQANTSFPPLTDNEIALFPWREDSDRSNECATLSGKAQSRTIDCKTEYRCVKEVEKDNSCRNQAISSYVAPAARVFHEAIGLGTDIKLHYQSDYLNNETIARGWSLDTHHILDGNYLHLGSGKFLNISSYKSVENNTTTITLENESYIFNELNQHIATRDNHTSKTLYSFTYNANNKLISVADSFNNTTTLQRDANDIVTSITAPHSQINYIYVDTNNDLINVTYEDNSNYSFFYESHLMVSEIEPNGNEFLHQFDENGKIVKVIDAENGIWSFSNTPNDAFTETKVIKADGDEVRYHDYFLENDLLVTKTTIASGDIFNSSSSVDGTKENSNVCGAQATISYQTDKDAITHKRVPSSITVKTPNGLSKTTNYSQNYIFDANHTLVKKESITEINGAESTTIRDYNLSTATMTSPEGRLITIEYDKDTNLPIKLQVANLQPVIYKYDKEGRVVKIKQGPRKVKYVYDERGNIAQEINLQRDTITSYEYDQKDRVIKTTYPDGSTLDFSYDKNGNRVKLTTPTPTDHTFEYNGVNKRTSMSSPLRYKTLYSYDKQRRVTSITRPSGKSISNTYEAGRLKNITTDNGVTEYDYSCGDKVSSISKEDESISYTYDGELITQLKSDGMLNESINFTYNNNLQTDAITYVSTAELNSAEFRKKYYEL